MEELDSYKLRKHLVIWLLVRGPSFGEKTLLFHMTRSSNQQLGMLGSGPSLLRKW